MKDQGDRATMTGTYPEQRKQQKGHHPTYRGTVLYLTTQHQQHKVQRKPLV